MNAFPKTKVLKRLFNSFLCFLFVFLIYGFYAHYKIYTLSHSYQRNFDHALIVSDFALRSNCLILKMHRSLKDILLFHNLSIANTLDVINAYEKTVDIYIGTLSKKLMDGSGYILVTNVKKLFDQWQPIREEIIALILAGDIQKATLITENRCEAHVAGLENAVHDLIIYAQKQVRTERESLKNAQKQTHGILISILLGGCFILFPIVSRMIKAGNEIENIRDEEKEKLNVTLRSIGDGVITMDIDGKITMINKVAEELTGWSEKEAVGKTWNDVFFIIDKHTKHPYGNPMIELLSGNIKTCVSHLAILVSKDGIERIISSSGALIKDQRDIVSGTIIIFKDVTKEKENEAVIQKSERLLEETCKFAKVGGWELCLEKNEMIWTKEVYKIYDIPFDHKPTLNDAISYFHPMETDKLYAAFQHALEFGEPFDLELCFATTKGNHLWTHIICNPLIIGGKIVKLRGALQDITDRKHNEIALEESRARYQTLIRSAIDGFCVLDSDGHLLEVSDVYCTMTGYHRSALLEKRITDIECSDAIECFSSCKMRIVNMGYGRFASRYQRADGSKIDVEISVAYYSPEDRYLCFIQDITLRKKNIIEKIEAKRQQKLLEDRIAQTQRIEAIGVLAGGIAHDFNNLLFPIIGMSEMMLDSMPNGSRDYENTKLIYNAALRASGLVKQILSFSRQSDKNKIPIKIQYILKEIIQLIRSTIPANIEIKKCIQSSCGSVMGDPNQLHQVIMNLVTNAYHAVLIENGTISLTLKEVFLEGHIAKDLSLECGGYAQLSVTDTGHGIDPELVDKIFEPYFTTKEKGKGTGLGLSTVCDIVKSYGGAVTVSSEVGKGSAFHVYLPLINGENSSDAEKIKCVLARGSESILLVDDEKPIIQLEELMLEELGYHITAFSSSMEALDVFKLNPEKFDLVITDMNMPNLCGDKLSQEMIAIKPDIPIIMCTGFSEVIEEHKAKHIGIRAFLMKPLLKSELAATIRQVLDEIN